MIDTERGGHGASDRPPLPPVTTQWATPDVADPGADGRMLPPFQRSSLDAFAAMAPPTGVEEPSAVPDVVDLELEEIVRAPDEPVDAAVEFESDFVLEDVYEEVDTGVASDDAVDFAPVPVALETEAPYDADAGYDLDAMTLPESMAEAELALTDEVENFLIDTGISTAPEASTVAAPSPYEAEVATPAGEADARAPADEGWAPGQPPPSGFADTDTSVEVEERDDLARLPPEEDQPWEAFGRALQDALSWAGLAAEETPPAEPTTLNDEAPPLERHEAEPAAVFGEAGFLERQEAEPAPPFSEAPAPETRFEPPPTEDGEGFLEAAPAAEVGAEQSTGDEARAPWEPAPFAETLSELELPELELPESAAEVFEPPPIPAEVGQPGTTQAPPAMTATDPVAADLAARLEALAERLRTAGLGGLADAIARGDRLESSLALFIAGYRAGRED